MMDVKELGEKLNSLKSSLRNILKDTGHLEYSQIEVDADKNLKNNSF